MLRLDFFAKVKIKTSDFLNGIFFTRWNQMSLSVEQVIHQNLRMFKRKMMRRTSVDSLKPLSQ